MTARRSEPAQRTDVLIIGSGVSAAVTAGRLNAAHMSVTVLEGGTWPDYRSAARDDFELTAPRDWNWNPAVRGALGDYPICDSRSAITPFMFNGVGGSAVMYAGQWERFLPSDFRTHTLDGVGDDWPVTYEDLEPYYDEVERQFGVSGLEGDPALPQPMTPPPLPPVPLGRAGRLGARALNELGYHWWPGTNAIATREYRNLHACAQHTACALGCPTGAKASPDRTHWPALVKAGVRLVTGARVRELLTTRRGHLVDGALYVDEDGREQVQRAQVVILCANAMGTPRILLASNGGGGLANSSGLVGRRLMMHPFGNAIGAGFEEDLQSWRGPNGQYLHSLHFYETDSSRGFVRGAKWNLMPGGAPLSMMLPGLWQSGGVWGQSFHQALRRRLGRSAIWSLVCEDLPEQDNRVVLSSDTDSAGNPGLEVQYTLSRNSRDMLAWHLDKLRQVLGVMGAREIIINGPVKGSGWHHLGTAVMGSDPAASVVNPWGRCHDIPNLLVFDGSTFPTSSGMNPAATIAANALRCADALVSTRLEQEVPA